LFCAFHPKRVIVPSLPLVGSTRNPQRRLVGGVGRLVRANGAIGNGLDQPGAKGRRWYAEDEIAGPGASVEIGLRDGAAGRRIGSASDHEQVVHAAVGL